MVGGLKTAIKVAKPNSLKDVDADELKVELVKKGNGWFPSNELTAHVQRIFGGYLLTDAPCLVQDVLTEMKLPDPQARQILVLVEVPHPYPKDCNFVTELCHGLSAPFDNEAKFAEKSRDLLTDYLLEGYPALVIASVAVNGSSSDGSYYFGETLLLNLQCKLQQGDGGGDPTMQNIAFYIKTLPKDIDRHFPCFLWIFATPIEWFGIVNTSDEDANCEPLVSSFPLLYFDNEQLIVSLARVCAALKTAV
ncbi:Crinkler (CRN) [Phytophthora megakarya]|uniref:Crinkler (CRN) n=1 Tax=Phytophthora megakarya TaxID=4795 RepID=A0A225UZU0_9STRA|nr:Crinkler (CRN) [Phytophthora megakarya]